MAQDPYSVGALVDLLMEGPRHWGWTQGATTPAPKRRRRRYKLRPDTPWTIERDKAFRRMATTQRNAPEDAMLRIQMSGIANEYGLMAEHVGDLTHRMGENITTGTSTAREKIAKTRRWIRDPWGFRTEMNRQVLSNVKYHREHWRELPPERRKAYRTDLDSAHAELERRGRAYANEHRKVPVWNRPQWHAREAAVALGEMRFRDVKCHLDRLAELEPDSPRWRKAAGRYTGRKYTKPRDRRHCCGSC